MGPGGPAAPTQTTNSGGRFAATKAITDLYPHGSTWSICAPNARAAFEYPLSAVIESMTLFVGDCTTGAHVESTTTKATASSTMIRTGIGERCRSVPSAPGWCEVRVGRIGGYASVFEPVVAWVRRSDRGRRRLSVTFHLCSSSNPTDRSFASRISCSSLRLYPSLGPPPQPAPGRTTAPDLSLPAHYARRYWCATNLTPASATRSSTVSHLENWYRTAALPEQAGAGRDGMGATPSGGVEIEPADRTLRRSRGAGPRHPGAASQPARTLQRIRR